MNEKHKIVITTHQPRRRWAIVAGSAVVLLLAGFGLYSYVRATTVSDFERAQTERDRLLDERRSLTRDLRAARAENTTLRDQVAYLSRSQEIDGAACSSVKQSITQLQAESSDLREQLAFYRGIVSPKESQAGVRVYDFKVSKLKTGSNLFRYDLVLIQSVRNEKRVGGDIDLLVEGLRSGRKEVLHLAELAADSNKNLLFSFRYFQEFSGQIRVPDGFRPLRATIALQPDGDAPKIEDEYEWAKILQEAIAP
ncbi:MAG: hypothetical protein NVS9B10_18570 [Nevskia sp.]